MRARKTVPGDLPALKALWKQAFGDSDAEIDAFFTAVYPSAFGFCAEEDGRVIAMLYALPVTLAEGEQTQKAAYLYAVATDEAFRKRGVCRSLMEYAERALQKRYLACLLLVPATETLAQYYETLGYTRQNGCILQTLRVETPKGRALPVSVMDYAGLRETMLFETAHVRYPKVLLDYEAGRAKLFRLELGGGIGCAAAFLQDGVAVVEELLPDARYLPALAAELGAERYVVRTPGQGSFGCMAKRLDGAPCTEAMYLPFAFD